MSLSSIIILVLIAAILLAILFAFFHVMIVMLPAILIVIAGFWIAGWVTGRRNKNKIQKNFNFSRNDNLNKQQSSTRKHARDVKIKDVDD